ncbi:MAG TPA: 3D domain-containing protein [bacterium]
MRSKPGVGLALGFIALCFGTMAAADPLAGRPLGTVRLTYYQVAQEQAAAGRGDVPVFGPDCRRVIAPTGRGFHDDLSLQGTGFLADGRLLNFEQRCACAEAGYAGLRSCYREVQRSEFPWGKGAYWNGQFFWLQPFRSVAVDPGIVPIGSVVYVPELAGKPLPDGTLSNGCLRAEDTGIAVKGQHMDWFIGPAPDRAWLRRHAPPRLVTAYAESRRCTRAFP